MPKRRFNTKQRAALYLAAGGCCELCGAPLQTGFHADHVQPFAKGGETDVTNGQALCPACNLTKADKTMTSARKKMAIGDVELDVRLWQELAYLKYLADNKTNWMLYATPGAGKTQWALMIARVLLRTGIVERVVIVSPTRFIRRQWTKAPKPGIPLLAKLQLVDNNGYGVALENRTDFEGCSLTYPQVFANPQVHRAACVQHKTLVIFDEVHHAGEKESWGQALEEAFGPAVRRIGLTGTPWRQPKAGKIPVAVYGIDEKLIPDFSFTYGQAVRAGDCRPIEFPAFDGEVTYVEKKDCCVPMREQEVVRLGEAEDEDSQVLKDILRPDGLWMRTIIQKADHRLAGIIRGDDDEGAIPDAKGLVFVHDRDEARALRPIMKALLREDAAFIISDPDPDRNEPDSQKELAAFKRDKRRWAIVVDMVSEGVDIPSLYVGVYASRKRTPLRFLQMVGRFVRMRGADELPMRKDGKDRRAVVFLPAIQSLMQLAVNVEDELLHAWDDEDNEPRKRGPREPKDHEVLREIETSEAILQQVIFGKDAFREDEIAAAVADLEEFGIPAHYAVNMAKYRRAREGHIRTGEPAHDDTRQRAEKTSEPLSPQEEVEMLKEMLRRDIGKLASEIVIAPSELGGKIAEINHWLMARFGFKKREQWSMAELREARRLVGERRQDSTVGGSDESA
jgi:superfamily II DNA or RNA helicase